MLWCAVLAALMIGCALFFRYGPWALVIGMTAALLFAVLLALFRTGDCRRAELVSSQLRKQMVQQAAQAVCDMEAFEHQNREEAENLRSALSHSLRVPLSIVQGYAELLNGNLVTGEGVRREYLGKIVQHSKYISEVLGQQVSAARSAEELVLNLAPVELLETVRQAADDFQTSADLRSISIHVLSQEDQVVVSADLSQLTKVLFNLVENSVKYMGREGIVTIRISVDGTMARVVVKDDGMGLDAEETRHIFELNYQGSNRSGGHGHGLYLTRKIIEAHNGEISAESAPGQGMGITFTLPLNAPTGCPTVLESPECVAV